MFVREVGFEAVHEAQGGGLPEGSLGPALDETPGCPPLAESDGVGQGRAAADDRTRGFDVSAGIEQDIEHGDIITACGPVKWRLCVGADDSSIDVGARRNQRGCDFRTIRKMAGPIGGHV
jgi:hypothetical protein